MKCFTQVPNSREGNTLVKSLDNKRSNAMKFLSEKWPTQVYLPSTANKLTIYIIKF